MVLQPLLNFGFLILVARLAPLADYGALAAGAVVVVSGVVMVAVVVMGVSSLRGRAADRRG